MSSIRSQIVAAAKVLLDGAGKPAGLQVRRVGLNPQEADDLPSITLYPGSESVEKMNGHRYSPIVTRSFNLMIEVKAACPDASAYDDAIDPVLCWVTSALQDSNYLGGLATDLAETDIEWEFANSEESVVGKALMTWRVQYQTATASQERKA